MACWKGLVIVVILSSRAGLLILFKGDMVKRNYVIYMKWRAGGRKNDENRQILDDYFGKDIILSL